MFLFDYDFVDDTKETSAKWKHQKTMDDLRLTINLTFGQVLENLFIYRCRPCFALSQDFYWGRDGAQHRITLRPRLHEGMEGQVQRQTFRGQAYA